MKISSKSITAIKMFIDLGEHYEEGYISLVDISNRKEISKKFLEQIVPLYKKAKLLDCNRGNKGGYKLAKSPTKITLKDILYISETNLISEELDKSIVINNAIEGLNEVVDKYLSSITLESLVDKQKESYIDNYYI